MFTRQHKITKTTKMASVCRFVSSFHKVSHSLQNAQTKATIIKVNKRLIHYTSTLKLREVVETTDGNTTVVEGRYYESPRKNNVIKLEGSEKTCALCKLNIDVKYSDVLIISQFVQEDGNIVPRQVSGLCFPQHAKMKKLISLAHRAGLMQNLRPHIYPEEYQQMDDIHWKKYNVYFPEIIDE